MYLRRIAALIVAALMMHLNVAAADAACASHDTMVHQAHGAPASSMAGMALDAAVHAAPVEAPCTTPTQAECCRALAACSLVFARSSGAFAHVAIARMAAMSAMAIAPPGWLVAPDPPPPRV